MSGVFSTKPIPADITVSCFGEVLWDYFDSGKRLGGAPLNVCLRLKSLGIHSLMLSAVGADALGNELLDDLSSRGLASDFIAIHPSKKTSTVEVSLDQSGSASYEIVADTAWDNIELTAALTERVASSDIFVFGSLVGRSDVSLNSLIQLIDVAKFNVFDVNLRKPHYKLDTLLTLMNAADCIKLNDEELFEIAAAMGSTLITVGENIEFIADKTNTTYICVTKGSQGAQLKIADKYYSNTGYSIDVVDTVGAGDSFLGSLIYQLCTTHDAQYALDFACAVGAMVAQSHGATPEFSHEDIQQFMNAR
jgi:fructokinase